jgi:hypothetical protein
MFIHSMQWAGDTPYYTGKNSIDTCKRKQEKSKESNWIDEVKMPGSNQICATKAMYSPKEKPTGKRMFM